MNVPPGPPLSLNITLTVARTSATVTVISVAALINAENGDASATLTKSGGNEFHGNPRYYWNGSVFNGNDWINKAFGNPRP